MDKNPIVLKLNNALPGAVLEVRRFGRSNVLSIWVENQCIRKVGGILLLDPVCKLNWLENLSIVEFEKVLVATYFLRSTVTDTVLLLRASVVPQSPDAKVFLPSVRSLWTTAIPLEDEAEEMFGVQFQTEGKDEDLVRDKKLPPMWEGFPLRKNYLFPKSFLGIEHSRPLNPLSSRTLVKKLET